MSRGLLALLLGGLVLVPRVGWTQDAQVQKGQQLFKTQQCTLCHSIGGKGGKVAALDGIGAKLSAEEIRQWIVDAKTMAQKAKSTKKPPMKDFSKLPKGDVDALVAYLQTLK